MMDGWQLLVGSVPKLTPSNRQPRIWTCAVGQVFHPQMPLEKPLVEYARYSNGSCHLLQWNTRVIHPQKCAISAWA
jgi:hypothetical protein